MSRAGTVARSGVGGRAIPVPNTKTTDVMISVPETPVDENGPSFKKSSQ